MIMSYICEECSSDDWKVHTPWCGHSTIGGVPVGQVMTRSDPTDSSMPKVFVYGTLRKGFPLHYNMKEGNFLGSEWLRGFIMAHEGTFPAACKLPDSYSEIYGEVYSVPDAVLVELDNVEGVKYGLFTRIEIESKTYGKMWLYVRENLTKRYKIRRVQSGRWCGENSYTYEYVINKDIYNPKIDGEKPKQIQTTYPAPFVNTYVYKPPPPTSPVRDLMGWNAQPAKITQTGKTYELSPKTEEPRKDINAKDINLF